MKELSRRVIEYVLEEGACAAGIATVDTLAGGPPSADLTNVLPGAKAAVSFAVPLNQDLIGPYLKKQNRRAHELDNLKTNALASGIAAHIAHWLTCKGYESVPLLANEQYREDTPRGKFDMMPPLSLRYLAVRSGVGHFGLSGNVHTQKEGAAVILGAAVTTAELVPTDPLPASENYCDECRLCMNACLSRMMDAEEKTTVELGGEQFTYAKRGNYLRCELVCGGFTGLHPSGKWSTWSPGRFTIPEKDEDFMGAVAHAYEAYAKRPEAPGGHRHILMDPKLILTCGNCQLICHPDKNERQKRWRWLVTGGVVVQDEDGTLRAVPPAIAKKHLAAMPPERRALYEEVEEEAGARKQPVSATG
ncbi:MAG: epoxyqueuosine reductase [Deltaproteobacteria bacterium]|nr:MAG: epoxyqueuosine reductase [Deltaproteobacteria bacterium]